MPTFISVAKNGHILDANEAFTFTTGYRLAEVIGRSAAELQLWDGAAAQRMLDAPSSNRFSGACLFAAGAAIREKRKIFFSEEKKQKTFCRCRGSIRPHPSK